MKILYSFEYNRNWKYTEREYTKGGQKRLTHYWGQEMASYENWKEKEYVVTTLFLDTLNPRLPDVDKKLSQKELIEELIKHEDVYEIAKSIAENGYYPVERLICVKNNNKKIIVEGNRRLAALKLLISPESAPEKEQKKYRKLSTLISTSQIKKVKVAVAPNRTSANHYIQNKHTSPTIRPWKPIQQAKFYKNMVDSGLTLSVISKEYAISLNEIKESFQLLDMYNVACDTELPENIKSVVLNSRKFPASTLQRVFQNKKIRDFLGIDFDNNKKLIGKVKKEEFRKGYAKIIKDIVVGGKNGIDSRKLNQNKDVDAYLKSISEYKPNLKLRGKFYINDLVKGEKKPKIVGVGINKKSERVTKRRSSLIPARFKCDVDNEKIRGIFTELNKLKIVDYANSVSILLRVILEMSLAHYLDQTGQIDIMIAKMKIKTKGKMSRDYYPTLGQMLKFILNDENCFNVNPQAKKLIEKLMSTTDSLYSKNFLDNFVHNKFLIPSESQLRAFWEQLEPIFKVTLVEPVIKNE